MKKISQFIATNRERTLNYLRSKFTSLQEEDMEDVYQDASIALVKNAEAGKLESLTSGLYTYFLRICINLSLKQVNRLQKMSFVTIGDEKLIPSAVSSKMIEEIIQDDDMSEMQEERDNLVRQTLRSMSEQCQQLLTCYYVEGKNWATVAVNCGLSGANSAKSIAYRYRGQFKERYRQLATASF